MSIITNSLKKTILMIIVINSVLAGNNFSYEQYPSTVHAKQLFPITIKSNKEINSNIEFIFDIDASTQPTSDKPIINTTVDTNQYRFFFKADKSVSYTPKISILYDGKIETLDGLAIKTKKLPKDINFSGIIAKNLVVKNYQVSKYDKLNNIIMLSLEAIDGNAGDMHLDIASKEESENVLQNFNSQSCSYYAIIDTSVKKIDFSYFNLSQNKFTSVSIPAIVKDATVAAQSNPNPDYDQFEKLKKYLYGVMILLMFYIYFKRRKVVYILIAFVFLTLLIVSNLPRESICIKNGTQIYVLPVGISKIAETIDENISTQKFSEQNGFVKIAYKKNKIGWVRVEDICEN